MKNKFKFVNTLALLFLTMFIWCATVSTAIAEKFTVDDLQGNAKINGVKAKRGDVFDYAQDIVAFENTSDCLIVRNTKNEIKSIIPKDFTTDPTKFKPCKQCQSCCQPNLVNVRVIKRSQRIITYSFEGIDGFLKLRIRTQGPQPKVKKNK